MNVRILKLLIWIIVAKITIVAIIITSRKFSKIVSQDNKVQKLKREFKTQIWETCNKTPPVSSIVTESKYWQVLDTSNGTFKMFNAYYDARNFSSVVRILSFIDVVDAEVKTFCHLWFQESKSPVVSEAFEYKLMWHKSWGINKRGSQPHLVLCKNPLADHGFVPSHVSLVKNKCDSATNHLKVIYNLPKEKQKKSFAVCAKDLDFMDDQTMQLVEWVETLVILGAEKIFVYVINLHPSMINVLEYYEAQGKVKLERMSEPKGLPSRSESITQWLQNQMMSLNDCLYKHMYEYEFLVPLDIDEIIVPKRPEDRTWKDLMMRTIPKGHSIKQQTFSAYVARNVFFLLDNNHQGEIQPGIPSDMLFLQHIYRAANFSQLGVGPKSFQNTENVVTMHNHYPMHVMNQDYVDYFDIDEEDGQLQHYRRDCENYPKDECQGFKDHTVKDLSLWKFKDEIIANVNKTLKALKRLK